MFSANGDARDSAIGEDKNGGGRVDLFLDLGRNGILLLLIFLRTASVGEPRRVEDPNLGKRLQMPTTSVNTVTYNYAVRAREIISAGFLGPTPVIRTTPLVLAIENFKVEVINVVSGKDIGNKLQG